MNMSIKVYVPVDVRFDETGRMLPRTITWEDGKKYEIDKVTDIRPAPAQKAGGQGDRYTVWIGGKQSCECLSAGGVLPDALRRRGRLSFQDAGLFHLAYFPD